MRNIEFLGNDGTFTIKQPENYSGLYFPIAGEQGLKSAIAPNLGGDSKISQETFLLEPVSVENLHNNRSGRNFWCCVEGIGAWSVAGASAEAEISKFTPQQDESRLTAGLMWQQMERKSEKYKLQSTVTSFVPLDDNVEIMYVEIVNQADYKQVITPVAAIPIYGRSADNLRDHRHVTALLHQIQTLDYGVSVVPTMSFDEKGHRRNTTGYYVLGTTGDGQKPALFYPTVEAFVGEGGSYTNPRSLAILDEGVKAGFAVNGKEAMGGIQFEKKVLQPKEKVEYIVMLGVAKESQDVECVLKRYGSVQRVISALRKVKKYWQEKVNVTYHTGDNDFDNYMRWVSFQPILRRIYGCSFLPHHDYGRGGRGWRDLWQDCLSLLIMDPCGVRNMILDNYGGVRIDGTNATIIGSKQGEFIADRNNITRVWMDHGVWPFLTTKLYIDQTGDIEILLQKVPYFKDKQVERGTNTDERFKEANGMQQKCVNGEIYQGSILEHLLVQHLGAFYEVGEHNHILLRGADWNDAIDMASANGESVAFTCAYAGNLKQLAKCLRQLKEKTGQEQVELLEELRILLADSTELYEDIQAKKALLKDYLILCRRNISGRKIAVLLDELVENLEHKADWMMEHIRKSEWIEGASKEDGWFNSYYDDNKRQVEGIFESGVRMMLTGQVFAIMSGTAKKEQVSRICKSADAYLYNEKVGGYRLNTDFHEIKMDMGRMFGFAYGEKENGAVFSHMTVMYANALYQRGFVKEGYKALKTLADTALRFENSKIYPGIPEYFNGEGRGLYHYLTGAASWYMLTMVTEVFGIYGNIGNLVMQPKLLAEQFDEDGIASISLCFAGKEVEVNYHNPKKLTYGEYQIAEACCEGADLKMDKNMVVMERAMLLGTKKEKYCVDINLDVVS
ncbi:MAG: cellobiose phosphorylase [Lachnospiraceae bacterium]|nr:cellobiose phosphorylase [Lachnospiraceae bacterium]